MTKGLCIVLGVVGIWLALVAVVAIGAALTAFGLPPQALVLIAVISILGGVLGYAFWDIRYN